jgi:hypothetical protein
MRHLVPFRVYESQTSSGLTPEQEAFLNRKTKETWSVNPTTGLVDIQGDFASNLDGLKNFLGIEFGNVSGYFSCYLNGLQSLEGAPREVGGYFNCSRNDLQSLTGAPKKVVGYFDCSDNKLQSLGGAPKQINGGFYCDEFYLEQGKWNMEGWLEVLENGSEEAKKLILTLPYIQPDWWNSELQQDPGKTVHLLAQAWKHMPEDMKSKIKIPSGYENEFDLFSGFDELGFF